jgi:hypothetical protein
MPPVAKKPTPAPAQAQAAPVKNSTIVKAAPAAKVVPPAKNAALAAVAAAMAATAAGAAPQKVATPTQATTEDAPQKPKRWIVKKTLNKFKANLRSVPDYYLPKFIQLVAAEVAPRIDGDQQLSRSDRLFLPVCSSYRSLVRLASRSLQVHKVFWNITKGRHDFRRQGRQGLIFPLCHVNELALFLNCSVAAESTSL